LAILNFAHSKGLDHVQVAPINDYRYSDSAWCSDVVETVKFFTRDQVTDITLVGHTKRGNSYLKYFPQWKYLEIETGIKLNATDVRVQMLADGSPLIPQSVKKDWLYFAKEARTFDGYPFPDTLSFQCADAILTCAGHVLLIQRKFAPGAGNWAMPGGFKNANESFFDCAVRELFEETNVRVPEKIMRKSLVSSKLFDSPDRGSGIPRITVAHHFNVEPDPDGSLPRANGADDAMECQWVSIADAMNDFDLHDDHGDIMQVMINAMAIPAYNNGRIIY